MGCIRRLQVSLAVGGVPTQAAVPAASDLMTGQVLHRMLLLPLKKKYSKKLVNSEASELPQTQAAVPLPQQYLPKLTAATVQTSWTAATQMPRGDFRREKCSLPSNNHRRRDLPMHTSCPSQRQIKETTHLHRAQGQRLFPAAVQERGRQPRKPCQSLPPQAEGFHLSPGRCLANVPRLEYPT